MDLVTTTVKRKMMVTRLRYNDHSDDAAALFPFLDQQTNSVLMVSTYLFTDTLPSMYI
jgi:hypothetical protein